MKKFGVMALALVFPGLVGAVPYVYPYNWMTGNDIVHKLTTEPITPGDDVDRIMAHNYLNGMKDGTQGRIWCFTGYTLPHELNLDLAWAIKRRHTLAALESNAAPFVLAELRRKYPCRSKNKVNP